jgi:hypothetical protein
MDLLATIVAGEREGRVRGMGEKRDDVEPLVWWLSSGDIEAIGDPDPAWPGYIHREYLCRRGHSGRCRLWTPPQFSDVALRWPDGDGTAVSRAIERANCGGIVVAAGDAAPLIDLPGVITDLSLRRWHGQPATEEAT